MSTKRKRMSNDLIWARDSDHKNAQEHPCYLLENLHYCVSALDVDKVWVEWSSNGTVACIPKSRISTVGLSSRRSRRTTNNDARKSSDNHEQLTTSNKQKKRAPPRQRSNGGISTLLSTRNKRNTVAHSPSNSNSNTIAIPEQILVEGCGVPEVNGTYNLRVDNTRTDGLSVDEGGAPVYSKKGIWQGTAVDFEIYRTASRLGYGHWYIGTRYESIPSISFYKISYKRPPPLPNRPQRIGKIPFVPPIEGWERNDYGEAYQAYNPVPTLTYKYKSNDDNIASPVINNTKVKKEDGTKVKEEMYEYGRETDDEEEDRKIAALPSLVSSSSQLTTNAYDEDTDEDIAPDPVQSTQLKVKEEEEDTDDEGISPDPVESAQIKVKTEEAGEDTDDGAPAPDQIQSTQLKSEEDLYGQDTDEENGKVAAAPSPIASAKVKSEQINSYDMETDDEDSKLDAPSPVVKTEEEVTDNEGTTASSAIENTTHGGSSSSQVVLQKRWCCDVCKVKWFLDFSEAVEHEKTCEGWPTDDGQYPNALNCDLRDFGYGAPDDSESEAESSLSTSSDVDESEDDKDEDRKIAADDDSDTESISTWDSSNEKYNESAKVYLWCEGQYGYKEYALVLLPYNYYLFWKKLKRCKTFGDIRKLCGKGHYYNFEEKYAMNHDMKHDYDSDYDDYDTCLKKLTDSTKVCMDDFDLSEHSEYGDCTAVGHFPPLLEQVMWEAAKRDKERHGWMLEYGEIEEPWGMGECWLKFKSVDKDKIFKKIEELGCTVRHFPKLGEEFISIFQM